MKGFLKVNDSENNSVVHGWICNGIRIILQFLGVIFSSKLWLMELSLPGPSLWKLMLIICTSSYNLQDSYNL